jgi:DNA-binding NarL/FixJ family response regulator
MRVVIADDSPLLRKGVAQILAENGIEVVAEVGDAARLLDAVEQLKPNLAIVDVRMPPTQTDEGARAAVDIRAQHPDVAVLLLSQVVEAQHALKLFSEHPAGFGYLLKDRVLAIDDFIQAVNRVAGGGTAIDPDVVSQLLGRRRTHDPLDELTGREREILALMAEGLSNHGICHKLFLAPKTVEGHVHNIFAKLGITSAPDEHRRVIAVLTYLHSGPQESPT